MKKKLMIFVTLFIFMFGINNVSAMTLKPSGASSGKRGDEITLYITLERSSTEKTVSAVDGTVSYDADVLKLVSSSNLMEGWTEFAGISNGNTFGYGNITFDKLITTTSQNIVKMTFKINGSANYGNTTVSVSNPSATDDNGDSVSVSGGSHNVKVLSDVNTLSNLTISNGTINFNENTTEYNLTIDSDSTNISATKKDENSKISGDTGNKSLNYGVNTFKITVTSESGKSKVYTINITRPDNRSTEKDMLDFEFVGHNINFNKDTTEYNLNLENDISKLAICNTSKTGVLCLNEEMTFSEKTTVEVTFNGANLENLDDKELDIKEGKNVLQVKVIAENETEKEYTFNINRKAKVIDNGNNNNPGNQDITENPKTGGTVFVIVTICVLGIASLILGIYYFEKRKKKTNNI